MNVMPMLIAMLIFLFQVDYTVNVGMDLRVTELSRRTNVDLASEDVTTSTNVLIRPTAVCHLRMNIASWVHRDIDFETYPHGIEELFLRLIDEAYPHSIFTIIRLGHHDPHFSEDGKNRRINKAAKALAKNVRDFKRKRR